MLLYGFSTKISCQTISLDAQITIFNQSPKHFISFVFNCFFSTFCSPEDVDCGFDNPAEHFSLKVRKKSLTRQTFKEVSFLSNSAKVFLSTRKNVKHDWKNLWIFMFKDLVNFEHRKCFGDNRSKFSIEHVNCCFREIVVCFCKVSKTFDRLPQDWK